jgi:CcmD family protein
MGTLVAAYLAVWLATSLYVVRLGARQLRLERRLEVMQRQLARSKDPQNPASKAA